MGATTFMTTGSGSTMHEAFASARAAAQHEHGFEGYTGSLAEKMDAVLVTSDTLNDETAGLVANKLLDEADPRVSDKWGPAGAIPLEGCRYLFFGWASE